MGAISLRKTLISAVAAINVLPSHGAKVNKQTDVGVAHRATLRQ